MVRDQQVHKQLIHREKAGKLFALRIISGLFLAALQDTQLQN